MDERRVYSRIQSGIACLVYAQNTESMGVIDNISETGLAIRIEKTDGTAHEFRVGDEIMATGLDSDDVIQFDLEIMRVEQMDKHVILGTHIINSYDVEPYVHEKRLELLRQVYFKDREG